MRFPDEPGFKGRFAPVRLRQLGLHASWKWAGRSYRLTRGRHRWFAWAGFGRRSAARYKLLGSAEFVVARS